MITLLLLGSLTYVSLQEQLRDCGLLSVCLLARLEGYDADKIIDVFKDTRLPEDGMSVEEIMRAGRVGGLVLEARRLKPTFRFDGTPFIAHVNSGGTGHFVLVAKCGSTGKLLQIIDPATPDDPLVIAASEFLNYPGLTGIVIVQASGYTITWWMLAVMLLFGGILFVRTQWPVELVRWSRRHRFSSNSDSDLR